VSQFGISVDSPGAASGRVADVGIHASQPRRNGSLHAQRVPRPPNGLRFSRRAKRGRLQPLVRPPRGRVMGRHCRSSGRARSRMMGSGCPTEQAIRAQVLVEIGPMNSIATTAKRPVVTLRGGRVQQPRVPGERNGNRPTIGKIRAQRIFRQMNVEDAFPSLTIRSSHSRTPGDAVDGRRPSARLGTTHAVKIPGLPRRRPDRARTSLCGRRDRCARGEARSAHDCRSRRDTVPNAARWAWITSRPARRPPSTRRWRRRRRQRWRRQSFHAGGSGGVRRELWSSSGPSEPRSRSMLASASHRLQGGRSRPRAEDAAPDGLRASGPPPRRASREEHPAVSALTGGRREHQPGRAAEFGLSAMTRRRRHSRERQRSSSQSTSFLRTAGEGDSAGNQDRERLPGLVPRANRDSAVRHRARASPSPPARATAESTGVGRLLAPPPVPQASRGSAGPRRQRPRVEPDPHPQPRA
jgi:hypothetical protein